MLSKIGDFSFSSSVENNGFERFPFFYNNFNDKYENSFYCLFLSSSIELLQLLMAIFNTKSFSNGTYV